MPITKPSKKELIEVMFDKTNLEAAKYFNVSKSTIVRWLSFYNLNYYDLKYPNIPKEPNKEQYDLIISCLLGDGTLDKRGRFKLKLKKESESYLLEVYNSLKPFTVSNIVYDKQKCPTRIKGKVDYSDKNWNGKWTECCYFYTPGFSFLKELRKKWYPKNKKIVPKDLSLNLEMIGHWYMQDGCNNQSKKTITFHTNCFSEKEVNFLIDQFPCVKPEKSFSNNYPIIRFGARKYYNFINLIKPYVSDCFDYKIDTSKCIKTKKGYGACKLNMDKANKIRVLYATDKYTQQKLGKMFGVSQPLIGRIINNKVYKSYKADLCFGGSADVIFLPNG